MPGMCPDAANQLPRGWFDFRQADGSRIVYSEIGASVWVPWPNGEAPSLGEAQIRFAELKALIWEAEDGLLGPEDWLPVVTRPELWELRLPWTREKDPREVQEAPVPWRGYFYEASESSAHTVLAKAHAKDYSSTSASDMTQEQNRVIDEASSRITWGQPRFWGLNGVQPLFPRLD